MGKRTNISWFNLTNKDGTPTKTGMFHTPEASADICLFQYPEWNGKPGNWAIRITFRCGDDKSKTLGGAQRKARKMLNKMMKALEED